MRSLSTGRATKDSEAGRPPSPMGVCMRASGGRITAVDRSFAGFEEPLAGYAVLEGNSSEGAIERPRRLMRVHLGSLGPNYKGVCGVCQLVGGQG